MAEAFSYPQKKTAQNLIKKDPQDPIFIEFTLIFPTISSGLVGGKKNNLESIQWTNRFPKGKDINPP